jgi:hypothetical protein
MNEYIDVRGPWPIYFVGMRAYKLHGILRSVTIEQAREFADYMDAGMPDAEEYLKSKGGEKR